MSSISSLYRVRHSDRAKYLQLKVTLRGIELIVPRRMSTHHPEVIAFISEKQSWIIRHATSVAVRAQVKKVLPDQIELSAIGLKYKITYVAASRKHISLREIRVGELALVGDVSNYSACIRLIKQWLKAQARSHFSYHLNAFADMHSLPYRMLSVRYMQTRWGSCSAEKNINLCVHILFLPFHLFQYVLLHELCHTKIMNHKPAFWRALSKYDPHAIRHAEELRKASVYLPGWIHD